MWGLEPLPDPSKFTPREGENEKNAARRRNADVQAEYNAVTCVAIYMLVMQFSQKGIDELRKYQEHMEMRHPDGDFVVSDGFDEGACLPLVVKWSFSDGFALRSVVLVQGPLFAV